MNNITLDYFSQIFQEIKRFFFKALAIGLNGKCFVYIIPSVIPLIISSPLRNYVRKPRI